MFVHYCITYCWSIKMTSSDRLSQHYSEYIMQRIRITVVCEGMVDDLENVYTSLEITSYCRTEGDDSNQNRITMAVNGLSDWAMLEFAGLTGKMSGHQREIVELVRTMIFHHIQHDELVF